MTFSSTPSISSYPDLGFEARYNERGPVEETPDFCPIDKFDALYDLFRHYSPTPEEIDGMRLLVALEEEVNLQGKPYTLLDRALAEGEAEIVERLVKAGAFRNKRAVEYLIATMKNFPESALALAEQLHLSTGQPERFEWIMDLLQSEEITEEEETLLTQVVQTMGVSLWAEQRVLRANRELHVMPPVIVRVADAGRWVMFEQLMPKFDAINLAPIYRSRILDMAIRRTIETGTFELIDQLDGPIMKIKAIQRIIETGANDMGMGLRSYPQSREYTMTEAVHVALLDGKYEVVSSLLSRGLSIDLEIPKLHNETPEIEKRLGQECYRVGGLDVILDHFRNQPISLHQMVWLTTSREQQEEIIRTLAPFCTTDKSRGQLLDAACHIVSPSLVEEALALRPEGWQGVVHADATGFHTPVATALIGAAALQEFRDLRTVINLLAEAGVDFSAGQCLHQMFFTDTFKLWDSRPDNYQSDAAWKEQWDALYSCYEVVLWRELSMITDPKEGAAALYEIYLEIQRTWGLVTNGLFDREFWSDHLKLLCSCWRRGLSLDFDHDAIYLNAACRKLTNQETLNLLVHFGVKPATEAIRKEVERLGFTIPVYEEGAVERRQKWIFYPERFEGGGWSRFLDPSSTWYGPQQILSTRDEEGRLPVQAAFCNSDERLLEWVPRWREEARLRPVAEEEWELLRQSEGDSHRLLSLATRENQLHVWNAYGLLQGWEEYTLADAAAAEQPTRALCQLATLRRGRLKRREWSEEVERLWTSDEIWRDWLSETVEMGLQGVDVDELAAALGTSKNRPIEDGELALLQTLGELPSVSDRTRKSIAQFVTTLLSREASGSFVPLTDKQSAEVRALRAQLRQLVELEKELGGSRDVKQFSDRFEGKVFAAKRWRPPSKEPNQTWSEYREALVKHAIAGASFDIADFSMQVRALAVTLVVRARVVYEEMMALPEIDAERPKLTEVLLSLGRLPKKKQVKAENKAIDELVKINRNIEKQKIAIAQWHERCGKLFGPLREKGLENEWVRKELVKLKKRFARKDDSDLISVTGETFIRQLVAHQDNREQELGSDLLRVFNEAPPWSSLEEEEVSVEVAFERLRRGKKYFQDVIVPQVDFYERGRFTNQVGARCMELQEVAARRQERLDELKAEKRQVKEGYKKLYQLALRYNQSVVTYELLCSVMEEGEYEEVLLHKLFGVGQSINAVEARALCDSLGIVPERASGDHDTRIHEKTGVSFAICETNHRETEKLNPGCRGGVKKGVLAVLRYQLRDRLRDHMIFLDDTESNGREGASTRTS